MQPRVLNAGNAGPFTLDGTRTFLVGSRNVAVIDPGPEVETHLRALLVALEHAEQVSVLVTHWHEDHAGLATRLGRELGGLPVLGPGGEGSASLAHGTSVTTDQGTLVAVATPGHAREHVVFHWPRGDAVFAGDLILGSGDTTWVGEYPGCVADYLESLARLDELGPATIYPAHGPPVTTVRSTLERYRAHRMSRIAQVREALDRTPTAGIDELVEEIYGEVPPELAGAARRSVEVIVYHLGNADRP